MTKQNRQNFPTLSHPRSYPSSAVAGPVRLTLPWPPTTNHYWKHNRGRTHISEAGQRFRRRVGWEVRAQRVAPFGSQARLALTLAVHPPDRRDRDLDNLLKSLLDALERAGVFGNDSQIDDLRIHRAAVAKPGAVVATLARIA